MEGAVVFACGWKTTQKEGIVWKLADDQKEKRLKAGKQNKITAKYHSIARKTTQKAVNTTDKKIDNKPDKLYKAVLVFPKTFEV